MPFSQGKKNKFFIDARLLNSALIKKIELNNPDENDDITD